MRVLMLAPGCDGTDVGESWSCYQWVKGLSEFCDITLLTLQRPGRKSIVEQLPEVEVVTWPDLYWEGSWERFASMLKPGYVRFYRQVRRWIRQALRDGRQFDLIHQIGPLALRYPSPGAGLGIPLVLGPQAGSLETPPAFVPECGRAPWFTKLRNLDQLRLQHDPWLRRSFESASVVIGVAPYVADLLKTMKIQRFEVAGETGIHEVANTLKRPAGPGLKLLYVGRVIRTKGLRDAVRAMSLVADLPNVTLDAIGMGEDLDACRQLAAELNLGDRVRFHGRLPRNEVEQFYQQADTFLFPSFREPSGNVVFEALGHGLPVITTNRGGPGYVVTDDCGFRVPAETPQQLAQDLATAIRRLALNPRLIPQLSAGALERIRDLAVWSHKISRMYDLYESVVAERAPARTQLETVGA
ncbi:MAG: glycosyltransferase [Planctomycetes bacterium]|nr:glycosyltransferase [Planctomycetota bacterium]